MHQLVPMVATLGLEYVEVSPERAVVVLRDDPAYRNHVGGPHAAAAFAVAESATGAVALAFVFAVGAVGGQALRAARRDPARSLRSE